MNFLKDKKAEMGIGTLIIFIAMILVAAIAAGVLVTTASSLQNRALLTGSRSRAQVSTRVLPLSLFGEDGSDGSIEELYFDVKLAPGSDMIKFDETLITNNLNNASVSLSYGGNVTECDSAAIAESGKYYVEHLIGGDNTGYLERGDVARICFDSARSINEDEKVNVRLVLKVGNPTDLETVTPQIMTSQKVFMYP
ncbi:MAG: archaellin/type IV pilin N-terminal domain-containing protein [Candidatus Woesearchaeota archaeon]